MGGPEPAGKASERRRHARHSKKFLIKFRIVGGPMPKDVGDRVAQVRNVSQGGLLLDAKREFLAGTLVELRIPENTLGAAKTLNGKICWLKAGQEPGDYEVGLVFVRIPSPKKSEESVPAATKTAAGGERRRSTRQPQKLILKLRCVTPGLFYEETARGGMMVDLSEGGLELTTSRDYAPGSVLSVQFPESPLGPARKIFTRVAWTRTSDKPGYYLIGAGFVQPPREG